MGRPDARNGLKIQCANSRCRRVFAVGDREDGRIDKRTRFCCAACERQYWRDITRHPRTAGNGAPMQLFHSLQHYSSYERRTNDMKQAELQPKLIDCERIFANERMRMYIEMKGQPGIRCAAFDHYDEQRHTVHFICMATCLDIDDYGYTWRAWDRMPGPQDIKRARWRVRV
jgi:hypothetical protein